MLPSRLGELVRLHHESMGVFVGQEAPLIHVLAPNSVVAVYHMTVNHMPSRLGFMRKQTRQRSENGRQDDVRMLVPCKIIFICMRALDL